ncbi:2-succinyl-5-enolpyruvyl-6-hydroxy-3-cyclohexene-1-carboxylic-acid synthase [Vibrio sp. AK197]
MSGEQATLNRIWAKTLLEELARSGVRDVCLAPGSRSTPLALEANANPKLTLHTHFDERGLGFLALGLAKSAQQAVAVIVTSGTAVANLLPAVAESGLTREKLVLLTSDRPVELVGCGANQAINQTDIFSSHVTGALCLPSPTTQVSLNWLLTSVDDLVHRQSREGGAIHINCPYPEPLYSRHEQEYFSDYVKAVERWQQSGAAYSCQQIAAAKAPQWSSDYVHRRGVIVVGSVTLTQGIQACELAKKLGWPILCDPQSGVGSEWGHFDLWLQHAHARQQLSEAEVVLQLGSRIVSKRLTHWLAEQMTQRHCEYIYVAPELERNNPSHLAQAHIVANIEPWIKQAILALSRYEKPVQQGWADELKSLSHDIGHMARLSLCTERELSEIAVALKATELEKDTLVFVGNSLFVRLLDMFTVWPGMSVYSNRGASGIDGLIATAAGVQRHQKQPMVMFVGDTSLLYDLNSLALMRHPPQPVVVVVLNNDGGAIFDLLPVPDEQRQALYQMPHGMTFEHAAQQFGLAYCRPETVSHYQSAVDRHLYHGEGTLLLEVMTPPQQAAQQIHQLMSQIDAL